MNATAHDQDLVPVREELVAAPAGSVSGSAWLLLQWLRRDYLVRYRQSLLGLSWALVQPLFLLGVYGVIFTRALHVSTPGVSYVVFAFTGLTFWGLVSSGLSLGVPSVLNAQGIITKVWFPREIIPLAAVGLSLVDFCIGGAVLGVLIGVTGSGVHWAMLAALPLLVALLLLVAGLALIGSAATVFVRDIRQALPLMLQLTFIATPIMYPESTHAGALRTFERADPLAIDIVSFRHAVLDGIWPSGVGLLVNVTACTAFFLLALWYFRAVENRFPDVA